MKVKSKLILGFGVVIVFSVVLSVLALFSLMSISGNYQNKLDYSQRRVQIMQEIAYDVMNMRRITTAIRADCGDVARMEGHSTASADIVSSVNRHVDTYMSLAREDTSLEPNEVALLVSMSDELKTVMAQYKRDLIDVNIGHGMRNDMESLSANSTAQAPLIAQLQSTIDEKLEFERELAAALREKTDARVNLYYTIFIGIAIFIVVVSAVLALSIATIISKPLVPLEAFMKKAGTTGDISLSPEEAATIGKYSQSKDEIGQTLNSCVLFIKHITNISDELEAVAGGNLDIELDILSNKDVLGISLQHTVDGFSSMLNEINRVSSQVSAGSKQIADGAQGLAQGSTEQAASVQQLSSSIAEIARKTKDNANKAGRAASLANSIMQNAEKGSNQMDEMTSAVREINQASQSISKVIKVIDDIAFQTNILALNAAVEAARAGQHGKGFAVVAEEVRNLAGKSAEAAKDTGGLIANSMEKAELGARIAVDTAASLAEIVSGINESTQIVGEIAASSEEQSLGIEQINTGIDQVAQVVQQNSATAQESAAASEEMSGQSTMLEDLISKFKLKDVSTAPKRLPTKAEPKKMSGIEVEETGFSSHGDSGFGKY